MISARIDDLADRAARAAFAGGMDPAGCRAVADALLAAHDEAQDAARALFRSLSGDAHVWPRALAAALMAERGRVLEYADGGMGVIPCVSRAAALRCAAAEARTVEEWMATLAAPATGAPGREGPA